MASINFVMLIQLFKPFFVEVSYRIARGQSDDGLMLNQWAFENEKFQIKALFTLLITDF